MQNILLLKVKIYKKGVDNCNPLLYNKGKLREREVIKMVKTKWEIMLDNLANRLQLIADKHIEELKKLAEKG